MKQLMLIMLTLIFRTHTCKDDTILVLLVKMKRRSLNLINRLKKLIVRTFVLKRKIVRRNLAFILVLKKILPQRREQIIVRLIRILIRTLCRRPLMKIAWRHRIRHVVRRKVRALRCVLRLTLDRR